MESKHQNSDIWSTRLFNEMFYWDINGIFYWLLLGQITWFPFLTGCAAANNTLHQPLTPAAEVIQRPCWKSASSFGSDQAEQWMEPPRHELTIFDGQYWLDDHPTKGLKYLHMNQLWDLPYHVICIYVYVHIYTYICTNICTHICGHMFLVALYIYIYIHMCIHTHIYTQQYLPRTNMAYVRFWVGSSYKLHSSFLRSWACHVALPSTQWKILISDRNIICK